jgi:thiol-disulfide isomerase/thioredoxin
MKLTIFILLSALYQIGLFSQGVELNYPTVGKPCPDFILRNIKNYSSNTASLKTFKNKWLVLDFWNKDCSSCIKSFPKINNYVKEFKGKVQFMLVGLEDKENLIRKTYERFKTKFNLDIPCAFDSLAFKRFDIGSCPHIIIIDANGIVRGITNYLDSDQINIFLNGNEPLLNKTYWRWNDPADQEEIKNKNSSASNIADSNLLFYTQLARWQPSMSYSAPNSIEEVIKNGGFEIIGYGLSKLYRYAYFGQTSFDYKDSLFGKFYHLPEIKVVDTNVFKPDNISGKNTYCFSIKIFKEMQSKGRMMHSMQMALKDYFGYDVSMEKRFVGYWKLIVYDSSTVSKLKSKSKLENIKVIVPHADFAAENWSVKKLLNYINYNYDDSIFIDETNIDYNIDITINAILSDISDIKEALRSNGLDLVKSQKEMNVLVIRDPKPEM